MTQDIQKLAEEVLRLAEGWPGRCTVEGDAAAVDYTAYCREAAPALARAVREMAWRPTHRHYKGGLYQVLHRDALHTEAEQLMVVYRNQAGEIFVRPQTMFDETAFYPGLNEHVPRFSILPTPHGDSHGGQP
jgi:hypothetical protein